MEDVIIVAGVIALAAGYSLYRIFFQRSSCGCGCGCAKRPEKTVRTADARGNATCCRVEDDLSGGA